MYFRNPSRLFGVTFLPLVITVSVVVLWHFGRLNNDRHALSLNVKFPKTVLSWRIFFFVYTIVALALLDDAVAYMYFPTWNWLLVNMYFGIGCIASVVSILAEAGYSGSLRKIERFTLITHQCLGETELPLSLVSAILAWSMGHSSDIEGTFNKVNEYGIGLAAMLLDFSVASWNFNLYHIPLVLIFTAIYSIFNLIASWKWDFSAYTFLNSQFKIFILWSILFLFGSAVSFVLFYFIGMLKPADFEKDPGEETGNETCAEEKVEQAKVLNNV